MADENEEVALTVTLPGTALAALVGADAEDPAARLRERLLAIASGSGPASAGGGGEIHARLDALDELQRKVAGAQLKAFDQVLADVAALRTEVFGALSVIQAAFDGIVKAAEDQRAA